MGGRFSAPLLKSKLEVAVKRMQGQMNKKSNTIKVQRREIAQLLADKKDESARIRVEALFHEIHLVDCMEILSLMCQLLAARTSMIASEKYVPDDLVEASASIIFCAKRLEIPELFEITKQFAYKFGEEWVKQHVNNQSGHVNPKVLEKLAIKAPEFKLVIDYLTDLAKQYNVAWEPSIVEDASAKDNVNALGAIAPINYQAAREEADASDRKFRPGTINVTIHEVRKLYSTVLFGAMDPYCILTFTKSNQEFRTRVMKNAGVSVTFHEEHFPHSIKEPAMRARIEVYNKNMMLDDFIGRCYLNIDSIIHDNKRRWYKLGRDAGDKTDAGEVLVSTQYMPFDDDEVKHGFAPALVDPPVGPSVPEFVPYGYAPPPPASSYPVDHPPSDNFVPYGYSPAASPPPPSHQPTPTPYHPAPAPYHHPPQYEQAPAFDHDLPSVPGRGPAAADDGPRNGAPDFDELEARFRALQQDK